MGKGYLYEGGIRVPLIVAWPGVTPPGMTLGIPVIGQDLYPTILAMAGVAPAAGQVVDGESLVPLLKGEGKPRRDTLYWHYPHYSNQGGKPGGAIREGDLKLIESYQGDAPELYDLAHDPGEEHSLAAERPEDRARLRLRLDRWRAAVDAQMPKMNPTYRPERP
jgi:arylsulfatase A-like enzyme